MITLADAKTYLGVTHNDDDALLTAIIAQVAGAVQDYTGLLLESADLEEVYDGSLTTNLVLRQHPVLEITELADLSGGVETVIASTDYDFDSGPGFLFWISGSLWGAGRKRWRVKYTAGYDETDLITPKGILLAIQTWVADIYAAREGLNGRSVGGVSEDRNPDMPARVKALLGRYRRVGF